MNMHKFKVITSVAGWMFESELEDFVNSLTHEPIDIKFTVEDRQYVALIHYKD